MKKHPLKRYANLDRNTWYLLLSEASLQLINGALMLVLFIYMNKLGYSDTENARIFGYRFLGVLLLSLPFGIWIKNKPVLPYFKISSVGLPVVTVIALYAITYKIYWLIYLSFVSWGILFSFTQICKLPYILRNTKDLLHTEAITLAFATWSFGAVFSGGIIYLLNKINPDYFDEFHSIMTIIGLSLLSIFFIFRVDINEKVPTTSGKFTLIGYDWKRIFQALFPTFLIATGAGMSIPYIPLFFRHTFNMDSPTFSKYGFIAYAVVFAVILTSPYLKGRFGYKKAIPFTQIISVSVLVALGSTELYNNLAFALPLALTFFILRQPLMNIAQPMTTEVVMQYVGTSNQEITSALIALIWNGSFVIGSILFGTLRAIPLPFFYIFLVTAVIYFIAIIWYIWLLKKIEKEEQKS